MCYSLELYSAPLEAFLSYTFGYNANKSTGKALNCDEIGSAMSLKLKGLCPLLEQVPLYYRSNYNPFQSKLFELEAVPV